MSSKDYLRTLARMAPKTGGGSVATVGGYSSLEDYGNSMFSKAKGDLIRSIAKDVAGVLKISSSFAASADLKDVIAKFEKVVPDPRKGRKIKVDKKIHIDVCKKIGHAINKSYKMELINVDASAENICQTVSELLYSLFTGLHSEFITVSGDVSRIMRNLNALQEYVDGVNQKLINELQECSPGEASLVKDAYASLSREIRRQHAYLANLSSGVIGPVGESLVSLLEESKSMPGLTDDLRAMTGSREFSDKLSHMMSGTSTVSHAAYLVDKALKQLGISLSEYKNTKDMKDLRTKVYDTLVKKKPNSKEMSKLLIAADILYRNDLSHDDIATHLSKKGGNFELSDGTFSGGALDKFYGDGAGFADMISDSLYKEDGGVFKGRLHADRKSIGRTLHKRDVYREKLFSSLNQQLRNCYNQIITELYKVGKKIGTEIKVTDTLRAFIRQLGYFSGVQPDRRNLHKALSGYRRDVNSEYVKHDYLKSLESVKDAASTLVSSGGGAYFKNIESSIARLIKVVDDFNDTFTKTLTEVHVEADRSSSGGDAQTATTMLAGLEGTMGGSAADFKYLVTMKKAVREIEYYFKIANIKANLNIAASQQNNYTKDYENVLGEECGMLIDLINKQYKMLTCEGDTIGSISSAKVNIDEFADVRSIAGTVPCMPKRIIVPTTVNPPADETNAWKAYVFMLEYIRSAKIEMIEAAQALDLYLSKFTEQIQSHPDDIKDFVKLLEQIEIVSKWFTDKSGDNLTYVFEAFASNNVPGSNTGKYPLNGNTTLTNNGQHYYETIATNGPGKCDNGIKLEDRDQAKDFIVRLEKSVKSMRALENIIATFTRLSNKSSGDDIKTFMSPGLIFKAFMKYTVATSIALGKETLGGTVVSPTNNYNNWVSKGTTDSNKLLTVYLKPVKQILYDTAGTNREWYYDPLSPNGGNSGYLETDDIFDMCIKSMISKVFTVVGAYSLYQRPAKDFINNKALANTPLRQIMGGGVSSVKIIPEATELYIRLTLLGEWYRELFKFKNNTPKPNRDIVVSMIPTFDGIWADFVKVIFVDAANIDDGGYTASFSDDLISGINKIYTHYNPKYGAQTCTKVLENFVAEVNLRYGLVTQDEINKYLDEKDAGLAPDSYADEDNVDYDILDSNDQFARKTAPSDRFRKESHKMGMKTALKNKKFQESIREFRDRVETQLQLNPVNMRGQRSGPSNAPLGDNFGVLGLKYASVDDLVRQTVKRITSANSDEKKYSIIQNTIMGVERYADVDYDCMLMFHETVINPLTILFTVYKMINHFNRFANSLHFGNTCANSTVTMLITALNGLPGHKKYRGVTAGGDTVSQHLYFGSADYTRYIGGAGFLYNNLMEDTINHLFYLTCDKNPMVEIYFSGDGANRYPMLSFKKLEKCATELIENVSESLVKFRKFLPHDIVSRYEHQVQNEFTLQNKTPENPNVVSLFYIKEHLIDRLIKNKYGGGLSDANTALKNIWLCMTSRAPANMSYKEVISKLVYWDNSKFTQYVFPVRRLMINSNWTKFPINVVGITRQTQLINTRVPKEVSTELLKPAPAWGNITGAPSEIYRGPAGVNDLSRGAFGHNCVYDYDTQDCVGMAPRNQKYSIKYTPTGQERDGREGAYGLVFKLNRLIYHYVNMFTDQTSNKIYLPLLEKFANGVNAREIMKGEAIDDITSNGVIATFPSHETDSRSVIFATLARAVRNIVTDKKAGVTAATILMNAEPNLLLVSDYMKDLMRAYLPVFEKQLNIICAKADLIKSLIENTKLTVFGGVPGAAVDTRVETDGIALSMKASRPGTEADSKGHLLTLLASITSSARSLQGCVKNVYKELNDVALYFETYQNSITDYKNRNGVIPLMPLSQASHLLNNQHRLVLGQDLMPVMATKYGGDITGGDVTGGAVYKTEKGMFVNTSESVIDDDFKTYNSYSEASRMDQLEDPKVRKFFEDQGFTLYNLGDDEIRQAERTKGIELTEDEKVDIRQEAGKQLRTKTGLVRDLRVDQRYKATLPEEQKQKIDEDREAAYVATEKSELVRQQDRLNSMSVRDFELYEREQARMREYDENVAEATQLIDERDFSQQDYESANLSEEKLDALKLRNQNTHRKLMTLGQLLKIPFEEQVTVDEPGPRPRIVKKNPSEEEKQAHAEVVATWKKQGDLYKIQQREWLNLITRARTDPSKRITRTEPRYPIGYGIPTVPRLKYYTYKGLIPHKDVGVGSDEFKFAHGTRGLLSDNHEPSIEMAPGVLGVLDTYNAKVGGAASYDKRKMVDSFENSTRLLRFATDYIYHKTYLGDQDLDKLTGFYIVGATTTNGLTPPTGVTPNTQNINVLQHLACQTGKHSLKQLDVSAGLIASNDQFFINTSNITLLTENDNYKQSVYRMLRCIIDNNLSEHMHESDRRQLRIYNILDSNIVPINFHALQREIPLINIFNYSYTFDQMVKQFIGVETASRPVSEVTLQDGQNAKELTGLAGSSRKIGFYPEDALVRILLEPRGKRYVVDYVNNIWRLMAGAEGLTLNKPKYLSDQLWNKVLLNSLYPKRNDQRFNVVGTWSKDGTQMARTMEMGKHQDRNFNEPLDGFNLGNKKLLNYGYNEMTYLGNISDKHKTNVKSVNGASVPEWHKIGYDRYHTTIVRYVEWFVHLQRVMRLLMRDQLSWVNDPIVHKSNVINEQVTEYDSNRKFELSDFE